MIFLLVHFPNGHSSHMWARLKSAARNFSLVSYITGKGPSASAFDAFPGSSSRKPDGKQSSWGLSNCTLIWNVGIASSGLACSITMLAPYPYCLKSWNDWE